MREVPNLIQIFSLMTIFTFFLNSLSNRVVFILIISTLLFFYLLMKTEPFISEEIDTLLSDRSVSVETRVDTVFKDWIIYLFSVIICFALLSYWFSLEIKPVY